MSLMDKLPYFYNNGITKPIIEAEEIERDILFEEIQDTLKQCFVETATWGLEYWERMLCISNTKDKTYEERRSIIYTKLRGTQTTTVEVITQLAKSFFESENVYVIEENSNYIFNIEFENAIFEVNNLADLHQALEIYKPAHLNYSFTFTNKGVVITTSNLQKGYCALPICNVTHVGTWWHSYADGIGITSQLPQAVSYSGYSALVVCGIYKNIIKTTKEIFKNSEGTLEFSNIVGEAVVGKSIID